MIKPCELSRTPMGISFARGEVLARYVPSDCWSRRGIRGESVLYVESAQSSATRENFEPSLWSCF